MFDFLKKKLSLFKKKEEQKLEAKLEEQVKPAAEPFSSEAPETPEGPSIPESVPEAAPLGAVAKEKTSLKEKLLGKKEAKKPLEAKLTLGTRVKQAVLRKATITEGDVRSLLDDFNLELVEADVASSVADEICERIRDNLVGREIERKNDIHGITDGAIRSALAEVLRQDNIDLPSIMRAKKPFIIMFVGPNGHGKTTTISKVAHMLKKNGLHVVLAAADTFRAASIEQLETLSSRVGVEVVRHKYGSDPAAVCFDAVKHAEARGLDAVLIDTAGRSELNINLMEQLKKIVRVAKPDMKVYVGEALAGNAAVEEARRFHEAIGLDGIIMSKADCDVKGGSILSIAHVIRKPILFIGTGQGIDDLMPFSHEWFIKKVLEE